jgi:tRNA A37 threonylcarbamoyladenosine dehydratase
MATLRMAIYIFGDSFFFDKNKTMTTLVDILSLIAERKCSVIFRSIGEQNEPTELQITKLDMTRKQFYSRISQLLQNDLVKKTHGKYELTLFGKVVFGIENKIQHSIDNYWKLKAIETLDENLPEIEKSNLIISIVDDPLIRDLLGRSISRRVGTNNKIDKSEELVLSA